VKLKKLAALGLVGSLLVAAAACGDDDDSSTSSGKASSDALAKPAKDTKATLRVWLNGPDTPQAMRKWAIDEFKKSYPNVTVKIEQQEWDGLVPVLTNSLSSADTPDIVEMGNTQAQQFEAAGALTDLTAKLDDLGGKDLLDSLKEAGTYDGKFYGLPLYAGARVVTYRTDLFAKSKIEVPTTLDEFIAAGKKLQKDNASMANFSGIYFPGRNWQAMLSFIWDAGGDIAVREGGKWTGKLGDSESVKALETVQDIMKTANKAPADSDDRNDYIDFCHNEVGMLMGPGWKQGQIEEECPALKGKLGVFPLPGASGDVAPSFLGGSVLGLSAKGKHQALAYQFLKLIDSDEFQTQYAQNSLIPNKKTLLDKVAGSPGAIAQAKAAENSRFTPSSEFWAQVEGGNILQDMGTEIGSGKDVKDAATKASDKIVDILNQ
jgi:ABC-type glycerol-3-phosphate transport system substrate-binding protein